MSSEAIKQRTAPELVSPMGSCCRLYGFLLLACWLVLSHSPDTQSHALGQSYVFLSIGENEVAGRFEITFEDIGRALSLQIPGDDEEARKLLDSQHELIVDYLRQRVQVSPDGHPAKLRPSGFGFMETSQARYLLVEFSLQDTAGLPEYIDFGFSVLFDVNPDHRGFVVVENDWRTGTFNNEAVISLIFDPETTSGRLDLSSSTFAHGFWEMTKLGIHHIWIGIDHILFLLALLLPSVVLRDGRQWNAAQDFRSSAIYVVKIVTLFTVAHTITLSAATLGAISIPARIVESVIAISIAIAALDLLWPVFRGHIWWVVFAFGLFHGMGFASVLADIGVPAGYMVYSLLAFNIGVELGQLAIVAVAFPLLYAIRQGWFYRRFCLPVGATALILVSMYWFVERGFLIDLPAGEYANWLLGKVGASG